jgi:hypothetical protein
MSKVLKDPIAVKSKTNGAYPFEWKAPSYDNRTSCSVSAGDDYGLGHKTPVGSFNAQGMSEGPIPQKAECFPPEKIFGPLGSVGKEDMKG